MNKHYVLLPVFTAITLLAAIAYLLILLNSLPPSDLAYGESIEDITEDPFVRSVGLSIILTTILIGYPIFYIVMRNLDLPKSTTLIMIVVLLEIAVVTPIHAGAGLLGAYAALFIAIAFCRIVFFNNNVITTSNNRVQ